MEDLIKKREQELIKEGLFIIESFERYTSKNKPDIYKEYLDIIEKRKFNNNRLVRLNPTPGAPCIPLAKG